MHGLVIIKEFQKLGLESDEKRGCINFETQSKSAKFIFNRVSVKMMAALLLPREFDKNSYFAIVNERRRKIQFSPLILKLSV